MRSKRPVLRLGSVALLVFSLAASGCASPPSNESQAAEAVIVTGYYCPPCGCEDDHETFHEKGKCPACGMKLIPVGTYTNRSPRVSPDGKTLAFLSTREGTLDVYTMRLDGTGVRRLTPNDKGDDENVSWSPDGTRIAYTSYHLWKLSEASKAAEIYVMNADGSGKTRLTNNDAWDSQPVWSPDGTRIAFASARDGNYEIYVVDADGANPVNLTKQEESREVRPRWLPDGTRLSFLSNRSGEMALYAMEADGANVTPLTDTVDGVLSPDGTRIVFTRGEGRERNLFIHYTDGSGEVQLTDLPGVDHAAPAWSPDGTKIYFESDRDGQPEIYVMNADGSDQTRLTKQ